MLSRTIYKRQKGRRFLTVLATAGLLAGTIASAAPAVALTQSFVELDKNATDNLATAHLGTLSGNITSSATSIVVCERKNTLTGVQTIPTPPFVIQIDGEQMNVTARTNVTTSGLGGCKFTDPADSANDKATYTVARGFNTTTAAAHTGASDVTGLSAAAPAGIDWDTVYQDVQAHGSDKNPCADITDAVACDWLSDPPGLSAFTQGSSDTADIPGWTWTDMGVPDADEILHAYAIKFSNSTQLLYFGADRYAVNGAKDMGFWFFKNPVHADASGKFVDDDGNPAVHAVGDILLLTTFTQGGAVTTVRVYSWVGSGGTDGSLDQAGAFGDCVPGSASDNGCATVNNTTIPSPWAYVGKGAAASNVIYGGGFMEGAVDLGALNLTGCFSSFMAETRSSPSLTAAQKDFTLGKFEACGSSLTTTPADGSGTALVDSNSNDLPDVAIGTGSAGVDVTDSAALDVTGIASWSGTLDFYLCGPIDTGTCDSGGVHVDSQSVDQSTSQPIVSASANLTEVGRYCWRGEFSSDTSGVPDGSDSSSGECFEVLPVTPALSTQAVGPAPNHDPITASVSFGDAVYDKATLSGTANEPGDNGGSDPGQSDNTYPSINATNGAAADGAITFTLVGPDTTVTVCDTGTPSSGTGTNPEDVNVLGDGDYFTSGFTPDSPGDFHWVASYSGSTSGNTTATDHNTSCDKSAEDVTVQQLQPTMDTAQSFIPNDSATVSVDGAAGALDGTVTFYLWADDTTCGGGDVTTADHTFGPFTIHADAAAGTISDTASTDNTTISYSANTGFSWVAVFDSNNAAHLDVTSACGNETSSITIDNGSTQPAP